MASSQSVQVMPFPLPPESSTLHIKNVPSRMQCKQCRRKIQLLGPSWDVLGRLLPYTWRERGKQGSRLPWRTRTPSSMVAPGPPWRNRWGKGRVGQPSPDIGPDPCTSLGACVRAAGQWRKQREGAAGTQGNHSCPLPQQLGSSARELARCHGHPAQW